MVSLSGSWFNNRAVKIPWHVHALRDVATLKHHGDSIEAHDRWVALLGGLGVPLFTSGTLRLFFFFFFFCHSPQHYMSDLTYFILFTSGNFSDAAEEFIFSQIWTSDLLFVRPACKPLIQCVCGIVVLLLCILIDLVRSALLPRKKKMIIKQSGKHLRLGLKYRTAPLLLWTFSS